MDLAPVVPGTGLAGERQPVASSPELDLEEALRHIDVRGAVLPHGSELDQVRLRYRVAHGEEEVCCARQIVPLNEEGVLYVHH